MAHGSGEEWRRRAVRFWILWRESHDLDDGQSAAARGNRAHLALQAEDLSPRGRRGEHPGGISGGARDHSSVVELAVQPQGFRSVWRARLRHRGGWQHATRADAWAAR